MEIQFFNVGCGDGIHIHFKGNDSRYHNIFIDGGTTKGKVYERTFRLELEKIIGRDEIIDLWIITHIDDDHIGGLLRFIKDDLLFKQFDPSKITIWYNYSSWDYNAGIANTNLKSVRQAIGLREYLSGRSSVNDFITDELGAVNFYGAVLTILSPNAVTMKKARVKWEKEETKIVQRNASKKNNSKTNDYKTKIGNFDLAEFQEDDSEENGSSISFILSFNSKNFLFLADSHPSVIVKALENLGYKAKTNRLHLDYMQISHHGSKHNTNNALLEMIKCQNFVISADGYNQHNLPNKETFARVFQYGNPEDFTFYITQKNSLTASIFEVDDEAEHIQVIFPERGSNSISLKI